MDSLKLVAQWKELAKWGAGVTQRSGPLAYGVMGGPLSDAPGHSWPYIALRQQTSGGMRTNTGNNVKSVRPLNASGYVTDDCGGSTRKGYFRQLE